MDPNKFSSEHIDNKMVTLTPETLSSEDVLEAYNGGVLFGNSPGAMAREIAMLGLTAETIGDVKNVQVAARGKYLATAFYST